MYSRLDVMFNLPDGISSLPHSPSRMPPWGALDALMTSSRGTVVQNSFTSASTINNSSSAELLVWVSTFIFTTRGAGAARGRGCEEYLASLSMMAPMSTLDDDDSLLLSVEGDPHFSRMDARWRSSSEKVSIRGVLGVCGTGH